jgi:hypothetical protein
MGFLYINSKGRPWTKHSYSAGNLFDKCPYAYYLQKVLGWKERDNKARFLFGRVLEESVQFHHDHNGQGAVNDFERRWKIHEHTENIDYTDVEKNWANCLHMGTDMIRLYIALQPSLPIPMGGNSVWQREYAKEVFPGDPNYGGIEDAGKLDIVCYVDKDHPMLPPITQTNPIRPLIVDIKTSAVEFPEQPGMAALDTQLRRYSWLSGHRDVSLLWFKKSGIGYKKGYPATFINSVGMFKPGQECVIAKVEESGVWAVPGDFLISEMERQQGYTKADRQDTSPDAVQRQMNFLQKHGVFTPLENLTRQRLQFNAGRVSEQSAEDAGRIAARQIMGIVNAWNSKSWPNTFGIRYPHDDRNDAYFRAFVLNDEQFKAANFTKSSEQSFDDLFREDD